MSTLVLEGRASRQSPASSYWFPLSKAAVVVTGLEQLDDSGTSLVWLGSRVLTADGDVSGVMCI